MEPLAEDRLLFSLMGDRRIWDLPKTAFLCSRKVPAVQVLKCYDWAIAMRDAGKCVMLGAHSQLEKDVLHYLLKGEQPVVVVLARGLKQVLDKTIEVELDQGRLLLVTPFDDLDTRVTSDRAMVRNQFMLEHAEHVVIGYAADEGSLAQLLARHKGPFERL